MNEAELGPPVGRRPDPDDLTNATPRESGRSPHVVNDPRWPAPSTSQGLAVVQQFRSI